MKKTEARALHEFIDKQREFFSVREMCRIFKIAESGFYARKRRPASAHWQRDLELGGHIKEFFEQSRHSYGSPRILHDLRSVNQRCGRKRVARLMQEMGLAASKRRKSVRTTDSKHALPLSTNRLDRHFAVEKIEAVNRKWTGDITYIPTAQGWLYLAVVLDLKSRRVIGWSMAKSMEQALVQDALSMAVQNRLSQGKVNSSAGQELLFHSDRGSQYAGQLFQQQLKEARIKSSMSGKGNCWDNAPTESFFASLKKEEVYKQKYHSHEQAKIRLFNYIEIFYNRNRRHSALGYLSPVDFERNLA